MLTEVSYSEAEANWKNQEREVQMHSYSDSWGSPTRIGVVQMAESGRAKVKELLSRHSELEQSETKAQVALVTVLSLTQITELKLLLDIGRQGHRFYDFVLAMLIGCICIEIFIGIIIIYIGNLHYYQSSDGMGVCVQIISCLTCCRYGKKRSSSGYALNRSTTAGAEPLMMSGGRSGAVPLAFPEDEVTTTGCCGIPLSSHRMESLDQMDRADTIIEFARIRAADSSVKIARAANYVKVVEEASRKSPGNSELEHELSRAREELATVQREREEAEAQARLAEAQQHRAFFIKEQREDRQEKMTFRRVSYWQHMATYLLYFVMLLNVFITTFGISTGASHHELQQILQQQTTATTTHPSITSGTPQTIVNILTGGGGGGPLHPYNNGTDFRYN